MTFLYSILLFFLYSRTGKKNLIASFGKGGGGGGGGRAGAAGGAVGAGGGAAGGGGKKWAMRAWETMRVLFLVAAFVLLFASPLDWFGVTSVGGFLGGIVLWGLGLLAGIFGATGTAAATLLLIIAVAIIVLDVGADWEVDKPAKNALIIAPLLALIAAGPIALFMQDVNAGIRATATASVSWMWGA